ncbi:MAG TPA: NAD(P)H-quinone oxidoreductase [Cellvibrionaceae bacterium]
MTSMQFITYDKPGEAENLYLTSGRKPVLNPGEVLIKVAAAGVNRPDTLQRKGLYPAPENANPVLGLEVAGVISALGTGVRDWRVGQRVCALTNGGGYAEYASAPANQCFNLPDDISFIEGAALPEALFTVWSNVYDRAGLKPGQSLLVHGGTGSIGVIAIQMGRITGARVYATAGSENKCLICTQLGAVRGINYHEEDFVEVLRQATGRGVDVILDSIGGSYFQRNINACAPDGKIVCIAFQEGATAQVNFTRVMAKRLTITGSTLRPRSLQEKAQIAQHLRHKIWPAVCAGRIAPLIAATFPLANAAQAHKTLEDGVEAGKVVLTV